MTNPTDASPDRSALVYRYHERLYRLALLTVGNADAAALLLQQAYRALPATAVEDETLLLRALLPKQPPRWRWNTGDGDLARSTLGRTQAAALLQSLARLAPAERLVIGLAYLAGNAPDESRCAAWATTERHAAGRVARPASAPRPPARLAW